MKIQSFKKIHNKNSKYPSSEEDEGRMINVDLTTIGSNL